MNKNRITMIAGGVVVALLLLAVSAGLLYKNFGPHERKPGVDVAHVTGGLAPLPAPNSVAIDDTPMAPLPPAADVASAPVAAVSAPVQSSGPVQIAAAQSKPLPAPHLEPVAMSSTTAPSALANTAPFGAPHDENQAPPVAHVAPAAADSSSGRATVFDAIDWFNTDNALLNAKIANAKLRKELADAVAGRESGSSQPQTPPFGQAMLPNLPNSAASAAANAPRGAVVAQVTTSPQVNGGAPTADVVLPSGGHVAAKVGTRIVGVGVVESVSIHAVMVNDGKRSFALPFESDDASVSGGH